MRMTIVDARTGDLYYPPISFNGIGTRSFDLPLLTIGDSVPQNPEEQVFDLNSNLMIFKATPNQSGRDLLIRIIFCGDRTGGPFYERCHWISRNC